jgi:hypothetical protein
MQHKATIFCICFYFISEAVAHEGRRRRHGGRNKWIPDFEERDAAGVPKWQRKLCQKIGRLAESVPGISCDFPDTAGDDEHHDSTRGLKMKLTALESKAKRLQEKLHKEEADKEQAQAKVREMRKEKSDIREKERQLEADKKQSALYKSRLEVKIRELENERNAKREREQDVKLLKAEQDEANQMKRDLEVKVHLLESDLEQLAQKEDANQRQSQSSLEEIAECRTRVVELQSEVARTAALKTELIGANANLHAQLQDAVQMKDIQRELLVALEAKKMPVFSDAHCAASCSESALAASGSWDHQFLAMSLVAVVIFAVPAIIATALKLSHQHKENMALRTQLSESMSELGLQKEQQTKLQDEFNKEMGGMMKTGTVARNLGTDFDYHIHDEKVDHGTVRYIKIQSPGVHHSDVFVEIIFNGCIVSINRQASRGVDAVQWEQRFQFRPSEGFFEFKEDQAVLDRGFLILVFRAFAFQSRPFRFPKHFDLAATDTWEYSPDNAMAGNATDPSVHGRGTAPGRLEMNAAAAAEFEGHAVEGLGAETSGSPIDSEDYEATRAAVAQAVALHTTSAFGDSEIADAGMPEVVAFQGSPEVTGDDDGAQKALDSESSSEGFEKISVGDIPVATEEGI